MAEKDKKFYWLKLKSEFMSGEIVDFLMSQKNGANYVVLYQMLAIKTMNTDGKLCSMIGECLIPFDPEKIQRECKWFDIDTIRVAMELYCKLGLIYKGEDDILQIANFEEMVGSETYWAKQKRLQRHTDIGQSLDNVQKPLISNISNIKSSNILYNNNTNDTMIEKEESVKNQKHKYGEYNHVLLTDNEKDRLVSEFGEEQTSKAIKYLDEYIEMKGVHYKNHNLALRKWVFNAVKREHGAQDMLTREYTAEEISSLYDKIDDIEV